MTTMRYDYAPAPLRGAAGVLVLAKPWGGCARQPREHGQCWGGVPRWSESDGAWELCSCSCHRSMRARILAAERQRHARQIAETPDGA